MKTWLSLLLCWLVAFPLWAQPKIGITLSGGGAKGLAHIGILEAIDSAGLRIDAITGTSMGSIIGSLYAAGYSGKEIEKIARDIDWNVLFSGKPSMRNVNIDEKTEFDNYALEVPYQKGKFVISSGFIEGQEIWLKFQELFLPIYDIKDFSKFSIPFKCIATDVSTGKAVVLDQGELVTAIRASMSIPSVFTAIEYKGTKLVDGGVVRNFPVRDVKAMGAEYVIGVNVSQGLREAKDLNSAIDILYQIGFYKDAEDFEHERKLCNILIEPSLSSFSAASFNSADSIIRVGVEEGKKYYPRFKKLADSLRQLYPGYKPIAPRLPNTRTVTVDSITIQGLHHTTKTSFKNRLALEPGKNYNGTEIAEAIRRVYGSRNYRRIAYHWQPSTTPGHASLLFDVVENPLTYVKAGIHYHSFSLVALIAAMETRNFLFDRSKSLVKINISENFRLLLEQSQNFGKRDNNNLILSFYHERFKFPVYENFQQEYQYRTNTSTVDARVQRTFGFHSAVGLGMSLEDFNIKPEIAADYAIEGGNTYLKSYVYFKFNTLNKRNFSTRGWRIGGNAGWVYGQHPTDIKLLIGSDVVITEPVSLGTYLQLQFKAENFKPLSQRLTLLTQFNTAINFDSANAYLNFFNIGGINDFVRNQVPFTGLPEYMQNSNSVSVMMLGFQYQLLRRMYATLRYNVALYDYLDAERNVSFNEYLTGGGLSLGYDSGIGPISISIMYSAEANKAYGYVNVGFPFR